MKITQADALTIWMDCHPILTYWCPSLCRPHHFYARCPFWHNPPNLSRLGNGSKYAGLHTQWLVRAVKWLLLLLTYLLQRGTSIQSLHVWDLEPMHKIWGGATTASKASGLGTKPPEAREYLSNKYETLVSPKISLIPQELLTNL